MPPAGTSRGSQRNLSYSPPDARQSQTGLASYSPPERPMPISYSPPERMPQLISYSPDRRRKSYQSSVNYIEAAIHHSLSGDMNNPNKILSHPYEHIPVSSFFGCMYIYIDSQQSECLRDFIMFHFQISPYDEDFRYRSQSQHNINFPLDELGGHRALTHSSLLTPHKYGSSQEPEYCTIRRGSSPYHRHHHNNGQLLGSSSKTPLLSNGSLNYSCSPKRSPYSSSSWGAQLPPPYPRPIHPLSNGRAGTGGRHSSNPPITARPAETKVKFSSGSKIVSGATYI